MVAYRQMNCEIVIRWISQLFGFYRELPTIDGDPSLVPHENCTARAVVQLHNNSVCVFEKHLRFAADFLTAGSGFWLRVRGRIKFGPFCPDFHRTSIVGPKSPLDLIQPVGPPARHFAS